MTSVVGCQSIGAQATDEAFSFASKPAEESATLAEAEAHVVHNQSQF